MYFGKLPDYKIS